MKIVLIQKNEGGYRVLVSEVLDHVISMSQKKQGGYRVMIAEVLDHVISMSKKKSRWLPRDDWRGSGSRDFDVLHGHGGGRQTRTPRSRTENAG
jgi:hypothetical protein